MGEEVHGGGFVDGWSWEKEEKKLCGWKPDYAGIERDLNDERNRHPVFNVAARKVLDSYEHDDTFLYLPLVWCDRNYRRGAQGIGDCVSWGAELACTVLIAKACYKRRSRKRFREAATEPIYGGGRVEGAGRPTGGWSDGSYGSAAAKWIRQYGVVFRDDYSGETGNGEHDLRSYSSTKAKQWGNYGCGGKEDAGKLDEIAKEFPVKTTSQVNSFEDCAAAIAGSKCPVTIASNYGCSMKRDKNGFCNWSGSWMHQMMLIAVRFDPPGCLCVQSWGPSVASGPHWPADMHEGIKGCSWWMPERDVSKVCQQGDSYAFGDIDGWKIDKTDFSNIFEG